MAQELISNVQSGGRGLLKKFSSSRSSQEGKKLLLIGLLVVLAGVTSGWVLSGRRGSSGAPTGVVVPGGKSGPSEAGVADELTFRDSAEGLLVEGGIEGEGTHHLVREGGEQKYVYLTSTVIDLQSFVGKKVQLWGETIAASSAPWLMDVGKIKVLEQ